MSSQRVRLITEVQTASVRQNTEEDSAESYLWSQFVKCFGLVALMLRALFLQLKELVHDLYARPSDWWIAGLVIFLLLWAAFRWRAGAEGFG